MNKVIIDMWYDEITVELSQGRVYSRNELTELLRTKKAGLNENSYAWAIGDLVKRGLLSHTGRNQYLLSAPGKKPTYTPVYSDEAIKIKDMLASAYPNISFTIFESVLLNEFLNHQIAQNTIFVQTDRDTSSFVFNTLRDVWQGTILYRPSKKDYMRYWQSGTLVVIDRTSQAPLNTKAEHELTIEKLLVDIYCDKTIRLTYSEAEYASIIRTAFEKYSINTVRLISYAKRRHKSQEIELFISSGR